MTDAKTKTVEGAQIVQHADWGLVLQPALPPCVRVTRWYEHGERCAQKQPLFESLHYCDGGHWEQQDVEGEPEQPLALRMAWSGKGHEEGVTAVLLSDGWMDIGDVRFLTPAGATGEEGSDVPER